MAEAGEKAEKFAVKGHCFLEFLRVPVLSPHSHNCG